MKISDIWSGLFPRERADARAGGEILYEADTPAGLIQIEERLFRGHRARLLFVDGALESAAALESGARGTLLFSYLKGFDSAAELCPKLREGGKALLIGGGGFVYTDHFLHLYGRSRMDVAEISPEIIGLARKYFFLRAVESEPETADRFRLLAMDGISALLGAGETYDLIVNDAFSGHESDAGLLSSDGIILAHSRLSEGGVYVLNLVSAMKGPHALKGRRLRSRFLTQYRHVLLLQADESRNAYERQNCLLIASDREF